MPIKYLSREELDDVKYNNCIAESTQSNVYAFSWYLDIVSDQWSALILNDYEAVMPLTWNSKFKFLNYAIQPFFCQQLGLYSDKSLSKETITQFLNKIPLHFLWVDLDLSLEYEIAEITNLSGQTVGSWPLNELQQLEIDVSDYAQGLYLLKLGNGTDQTIQQIVITR